MQNIIVENPVTIVQKTNNYTMRQYISNEDGFFTNSFIIEGPDGFVIVDTQFIPSATKEIYEQIKKISSKPIIAAFVLHANPDKFNGTAFLTEKGVRVVTSEQVRTVIPEVDALRREWFYERFKPDYPEKLVLPESICSATSEVAFAGLNFRVHVMGPSVSAAHIVLQLEDNLFVGDMVANKFHSWLELAKTQEWIDSLQYLQELHPQKIYPGRGAVASEKLLENEKEYISFFVDTVRKYYNGKQLDKQTRLEIIAKIESQYPGYGAPFFLNLGVPAVWEKISKE